jgi:hypothetical protein
VVKYLTTEEGTMIQDSNGIEIKTGDVVSARFRVMDLIADSEGLNLLVVHAEGHAGVPDDWRLELESTQVTREGEPDAPATQPSKAAAPAKLQATHATHDKHSEPEEEEPADTHHRGKHK